MYLQRMLVFMWFKTISCSLFFHILNIQTMHQLYTFQRLAVHQHYMHCHHWSHLHKSFGLCNFSMRFHNSKGSPNKWMKLLRLTHMRLVPHRRDKKIRLFVKTISWQFFRFLCNKWPKTPLYNPNHFFKKKKSLYNFNSIKQWWGRLPLDFHHLWTLLLYHF